jgi:hypothetical protein
MAYANPSVNLFGRRVFSLSACIFSYFLVFIVLPANVFCQQQVDSGQTDSLRMNYERRGAGGFEAAYARRSDGFNNPFFRLFYEVEIRKVFLNAGAFSYQKFSDGFGFDFRLRMPTLFYPSGSHTNFSPHAGLSFTVWPVLKPTVSVGIPIGLEYEAPIENFPNISVSANAAPLINLNAKKILLYLTYV